MMHKIEKTGNLQEICPNHHHPHAATTNLFNKYLWKRLHAAAVAVVSAAFNTYINFFLALYDYTLHASMGTNQNRFVLKWRKKHRIKKKGEGKELYDGKKEEGRLINRKFI